MDGNFLRDGNPTHVTLFYSKRTGEIKKYTTGITDLYKAFGDAEGEELALIYDILVIDYDKDIISNYKDYKVENNKVLSLKTTIEDLERENADLIFILMENGVI